MSVKLFFSKLNRFVGFKVPFFGVVKQPVPVVNGFLDPHASVPEVQVHQSGLSVDFYEKLKDASPARALARQLAYEATLIKKVEHGVKPLAGHFDDDWDNCYAMTRTVWRDPDTGKIVRATGWHT